MPSAWVHELEHSSMHVVLGNPLLGGSWDLVSNYF